MAAIKFLILLVTAFVVTAAVSLDEKEFLPLIEVDGYAAHYHADEAAGTVNIHILARATGYVGWGISPDGTMNGADIFIGGCNQTAGSTYFGDFHGVGHGPVQDAKQDVTIGTCIDNGTYTEIDFNRKFDTGDAAQDKVIEKGPIRLIWSLGNSDDMAQHPADKRGAVTVTIRKADDPPNTSWNVVASVGIIVMAAVSASLV